MMSLEDLAQRAGRMVRGLDRFDKMRRGILDEFVKQLITNAWTYAVAVIRSAASACMYQKIT